MYQIVISNDFERPLTMVSKSWYFSEANITKMVHFRDKVTTGWRTLIRGNHGTSFDDVLWPLTWISRLQCFLI